LHSDFIISVVLCTYNPEITYFKRVLEGLQRQTLPIDRWELIIVDNNSKNGVPNAIDLSWHPNVKRIIEHNQGLIHARITGTKAASGAFIVSVDDDTVLDPDYLEQTENLISQYPHLGIWGGRSRGDFETTPPQWISYFNTILCIKDLGEKAQITQLSDGESLREFPPNGPFLIAYSKQAFLEAFLPHFETNEQSQTLGRKGKSLASGEDNDITLAIYKAGYEVGYFPQLWFTHIIPSSRYQKNYLAKLVEASSKSWVQVLHLHGISQWEPIPAWSVPLRKIRAFFRSKAWQSDLNYIRWRGACGIFEGRSSIR
jgi:glycosyltransferase involved in cell wall biosynthesis